MSYPIRFTFFLALILFALSCKKEPLPGGGNGTNNEVIFSLDNIVDGASADFAAGMDDYYMFTEFSQDPDAVYTFSGTLKKENCTSDCGSQLRVEIRDFQPLEDMNGNHAFRLKQALRCGFYQFKDNKAILKPDGSCVSNTNYRVEATSETNATGDLTYTWNYQDDFSTGSIKGLTSPIIYYNLGTSGRERILGLEVEDEKGNKTYREHKNFILRNSDINICNAEIEVDLLNNGKMKLTALHQGGMEPFAFEWSTGQTTKDIEIEAKDTEITLDITGSQGCTNRIRKTLKTGSNGIEHINCLFTWPEGNAWNEFRESNLFCIQLNTVTLIYTDKNNQTYRSDLMTQSENNFFEVLSVEPFENNEKGEKTMKLNIKYQADVFSESGDKKRIEGEGVIAVAHP